MAKKLTPSEKYKQLKKHTENAGMVVKEKEGKIVVTRKKKK
jgi:DNA-binding transcriptional ArsR family regulator